MQKYDNLVFKPPCKDIQSTLEKVLNETKLNDIVLICGSFFIMADVRSALGI